jgi:trimeric autotransporter adhesin
VRFVTGIDGTGATTWSCVTSNSNSWACSSDRHVKENFEDLDGRDVLARLEDVPILRWNGKGSDPSVKHVGPMAQDFYAAFGLGDDDKLISTIDLDGVALAAIKALDRKDAETGSELYALKERNIALHARVAELEARLAALEEAARPNGSGDGRRQ